MAKKKVKARGVLSSQYTSDVIKTLGVVSGRSLLTRLWPEKTLKSTRQGVLRIPCPIHNENDASLDLDFVRGTIHCYGCHYHTFSIFRFLQDAKGFIFREALDQIRQHTSAKIFSDQATRELNAFDAHQTATRIFGDCSNTHLQNLISPTPGLPEYTEAVYESAASTLRWLFEERKRDRDYVSRLPYGLVPPRHIFDKLMVNWFDLDVSRRTLAHQELMDKSFKEQVVGRLDEMWKAVESNFIHAASFHTGYGLTQPGRIRLRRPNVPKNEGLRVLPGYAEDAPNGYYGLYLPFSVARIVSKDAEASFYLVEGEMDANACMEGIERTGKANVIFLASCGTANDTDALAEAGVSKVHIVSDEPSETFGKGDAWLSEKLQTASEVDALIFSRWDIFRAEAPAAKDPDEVIQAIGFPRFYATVVDTGRDSYRTPTEWAIDKIHEEVTQKKIEHDNVRAITEVAGRFGQCVRHPASQAAFIDRVAQTFGLSPGPLRQEIVQARDTEESFRLRITDRMRYEFHPMYFEANSKGHVMTLFHKQSRKLVLFPMNDGETIANALASVHGNVFDYVKSHIGVPAFLTGEDKDGMPVLTPEKLIIKDIYTYMKLAAQDIMKGLPERRACTEIGQGIFLLEDPDRPGESAVYVNNGPRVYKGTFGHALSLALQWSELEGPGDGKYVFRMRAEPWSVEISGVQDLFQGNAITLDEIRSSITLLERLISKNWSFVYQDTDPTYLAYHLFAASVNCAFPFKVITSFIGDYHSGKSTLLSLFCGITNKALHILEACDFAANFTPAAIYQNYDRVSLNLALDEFEDDGDPNTQKGRAVADISEMLRTIIGETGAKIVRGTNGHDGGGASYLLHTFVFIASILRARKAQDESRRFDIEMKKDPEKKDPAQTLFSMVSHDEWMRLRRVITLGMPKLILALRRSYMDIDKEVNTAPIVPFNVPPRYLRNMFPAAALMNLLGYDWKAFMVRVCESRRMKLQTVAADTASAVLYDRIFRTTGIKIGDSSKSTASLLEFLADEKLCDLINSSRSGVYFMKSSNIAVINWINVQSKGGLLDFWADYRSMDHRNLKHTFDQNPNALRSEEYEEEGVKEFIQSMGDQYRPDLISAVRLTDVISEVREHRKVDPNPQPQQGAQVIPLRPTGSKNNLD